MSFLIEQRCPSCSSRNPVHLATDEAPTTNELFNYQCPGCRNTIAFTAEVTAQRVNIPQGATVATRWEPRAVVAANSEDRDYFLS